MNISWPEIVFALIMLISFIGSAIANMKKKSEEEEARRQQRAARTAAGQSGASASAPSADELAARRRAQLEELARARRGAPSDVTTAARQATPVGGPVNLTVADAQQREEARRAYAQRNEALRRQRELAEQRVAEQRREAARAVEQQRDTSEQQREAAGQQRQRQLTEARRQARQSLPPRRTSRPTRSGDAALMAALQQRAELITLEPLADETPSTEEIGAGDLTDSTAVSAYAQRAPTRRAALNLSAASLRTAMALKEVLDSPISLRESARPYDSVV